jgi:hypothetical protein
MSIRTELHGRVTLITIDRPQKRNALDHEQNGALRDALKTFFNTDSQRVAVLTGAGDLANLLCRRRSGHPDSVDPGGSAQCAPAAMVDCGPDRAAAGTQTRDRRSQRTRTGGWARAGAGR